MTVLDWIILVLVVGVALSGFWKGAVRLVFGVGGLLLGLWLAVVAGAELAVALEPAIGAGWLAAALARLVPMLACVVLCWVAGWGLDRTLTALHLGWLNRLAGAALAGCAGVALIGLVVAAGARFSPGFSGLCQRSLFPARMLAVLGPPAGEVDPAPAADPSQAVEEPVPESTPAKPTPSEVEAGDSAPRVE